MGTGDENEAGDHQASDYKDSFGEITKQAEGE
jgi:hypothetical protein